MAAKLDTVTFHNKLGTQAERIARIAALAREIAPAVGADPDLAERAAQPRQGRPRQPDGLRVPRAPGHHGPLLRRARRRSPRRRRRRRRALLPPRPHRRRPHRPRLRRRGARRQARHAHRLLGDRREADRLQGPLRPSPRRRLASSASSWTTGAALADCWHRRHAGHLSARSRTDDCSTSARSVAPGSGRAPASADAADALRTTAAGRASDCRHFRSATRDRPPRLPRRPPQGPPPRRGHPPRRHRRRLPARRPGRPRPPRRPRPRAAGLPRHRRRRQPPRRLQARRQHPRPRRRRRTASNTPSTPTSASPRPTPSAPSSPPSTPPRPRSPPPSPPRTSPPR